jgi:hypothetical protein
MNTGMQDVFNLVWKLALIVRGEGQMEPLLESYSVERSAVGDQVLRGAGMMTLVATLRNPLAQFARNHVASALTSFGFVREKIKNSLCELTINYRQSPLSGQDWPTMHGGVAAGDRMPDAPLTSAASGEATTLFTLLHGTKHTLLLLPALADAQAIDSLRHLAQQVDKAYPNLIASRLILKPTDANPTASVSPGRSGTATARVTVEKLQASDWIDTENRLHQKLAASDATLVLIRPDGYIGYRCQPANVDALKKYLGKYFVT